MIIFLHIPKTAGSSFQFILENSFGISACHTNHARKKFFEQRDLDFARRIFPRLRSIAGHNLVDPLRLSAPDPFHVTFLREPTARVISRYQRRVQRGEEMTFEEFLGQSHEAENVHVKLMAGEENLDKAKFFLEKCDFVGLTEKFDLSLRVLEQLCPYKLNLRYKRRNVAPDAAIKKSIENDARLMDMAREQNKLDLALYDFAQREIFPGLCRKAGLNPSDKVASCDNYTGGSWNYRASRMFNLLFYRQVCKIL